MFDFNLFSMKLFLLHGGLIITFEFTIFTYFVVH